MNITKFRKGSFRKSIAYVIAIIIPLIALTECYEENKSGTFGYDLDFLQKHKELIVLRSEHDQCQLVIIPDYQGRVMTSTSSGNEGKSYGWINYDLIASNSIEKHINVYGGEDRFWLGPEGGQYSIFFESGSDFTFENWYTPAPIDTEPFDIIKVDDTTAVFKRCMNLTNYSGYVFDIEIYREVYILNKSRIESSLEIELDEGVKYVGFQSVNTMKNTGISKWSRENGLLSIWILGMFNPSEHTAIIIPYKDSLEINTAYFGEIGTERLTTTNRTVFFKADGNYRCKIGLPPKNAMPYCGSYDGVNSVLTIVRFTFEGDSTYVNSLWKMQDNPYAGDVVNSYNDGPLEDGSQLGPFYELESSSSAKVLNAGESITHIHQTYHFEGEFDRLNEISKTVLGVNLNEINFNH